MKRILYGIIVWTVLAMPAVSQEQECTANVSAFLGYKFLRQGDWEPVEYHTEFGILVDSEPRGWPFSIATDFLYSSGKGTEFDLVKDLNVDFEGETTELNVGVRKIWGMVGNVRPYLGGGLAVVIAEYSGSALGDTVADSDHALGYWVNGGVYWTLGTAFNIGLDLRYSQAEVTLYEIDGEAGGFHTGLLLGYRW